MSEEMVKYLLGGACGAMALVIAVLWAKLWKKDAEIDAVRDEQVTLREVAVAAREKIIENQRVALEKAQRDLYEARIQFEREHGDTIRKALSIVMAAKHKREPRKPSADTRDASTQMRMLTQELGGVEVNDLLEQFRRGA